MNSAVFAVAMSALVVTLGTGCSPGKLAGTSWRLVNIQSMDDTEYRPDNPALYTLGFLPDGSMRVLADCNRGTGSWTSASAGQLRFGDIAATQALCPPGSLHDRYTSQFEWVRSYVMKDGQLFLATMADGAIIEFAPAGGAARNPYEEWTARSGDAVVPGTDYHATGNISCSMREGQPAGSCPFGVKREGPRVGRSRRDEARRANAGDLFRERAGHGLRPERGGPRRVQGFEERRHEYHPHRPGALRDLRRRDLGRLMRRSSSGSRRRSPAERRGAGSAITT